VSPLGATTGAVTATALTATNLTTFKVGIFNVPQAITVNTISTYISAASTTMTTGLKQCVYDAAGNKLIDTTSAAPTVAASSTVTVVSPAVTLRPGNYYYALGCAGTCTIVAPGFWTTTAATPYVTSIPTGKKIYEGTVTMTSGTCNATLGTITSGANNTTVGRLDN
jgi:hypothetical protein